MLVIEFKYETIHSNYNIRKICSNASKNVDYKKDENENPIRRDFPASPAELLKPDKFLFYTYNDQGNMITKQMSLREIQTLIASGNGGHVAMEIYDPNKSGALLNGEKKVRSR